MGLQFRRRVRLLPGVSANFGLRGLTGISVGAPGAHLTFGKRIRGTVGIPGSGLYYTESHSYRAATLVRAVRNFFVIVALLATLIAVINL